MVKEHQADEAKGRVKEATGSLTGDQDLKNEGKVDQGKSSVKKGIDTAKEKANDLVDKVTGDSNT